MSILIVEDNPVNAMMIDAILQKGGYKTVVVPNASRALQHLATASHVELIISDIMMPGVDGLELLNRIKERPEWKDIPVVMCSALANLETVKKALKAGCSDFMIKPIDGRELLRKVREALRQKRPVIHTKKVMMTRLGLDEKSYEGIAGVFSEMITTKIGELEAQRTKETGRINIDLEELNENATCFGAERLKEVVQKIDSGLLSLADEKGDSGYHLLLRELRLVQDALTSHTPREKTGEAPGRSATPTSQGPKTAERENEGED
jgi:CheY-like chemotaxis protein